MRERKKEIIRTFDSNASYIIEIFCYSGGQKYENVYYADNIKEVIDHVKCLGYTVYAIDNVMKYSPINLMDVAFPKRSAFVFGKEGPGLSGGRY